MKLCKKDEDKGLPKRPSHILVAYYCYLSMYACYIYGDKLKRLSDVPPNFTVCPYPKCL